MSEPRPHLEVLEKIERTALLGLGEVLRNFGFVKNLKDQTNRGREN